MYVVATDTVSKADVSALSAQMGHLTRPTRSLTAMQTVC
jgi:hypothetical protein